MLANHDHPHDFLPLQQWLAPLQVLHRQFYELANDRCLLWVNPAQGDPFADDSLVQQRKVRVPIAHPRFDQQFAPYLVALKLDGSADAEVFKSSVRIAWQAWSDAHLLAGAGQPVAGWVLGETTPQELARHWANSCHLHQVDGLDKLLRFHDPGVREWLWPTLSARQQQQLLGPARQLVGFDRQQNLLWHAMGQPQTMAQEGTPAAAQRLRLTPSQWQQVGDYATLHAAWLACRPAMASGAWQQGVLAALAQATRHNIVDRQDRELFARHALQMGAHFHADERLHAVWTLTRAGEFYGGALEEVTGCAADQLQAYLQAPLQRQPAP